jgi:regulator of PEP synthase PpsR (kinase-PPPase family)
MPSEKKPPPIYIVSGASGASAQQLVHTVLVQFPRVHVPVIRVAHVRTMEQVKSVIEQAERTSGVIVHTLVDIGLRHSLVRLGRQSRVVTIDLMGELLTHLTGVLGVQPVGQPGLYRQLHKAYFERVAAIEFSMEHDDGRNPQDLLKAEIIIVGVSRVGKTPLCMYLAVLGWTVANVPLVSGMVPPKELFKADPRRVFALDINADRLLVHRRKREGGMGMVAITDYSDPDRLREELRDARRIFERGGFTVIDVTSKPVESAADEIIDLVTGRLKSGSRRRDTE